MVYSSELFFRFLLYEVRAATSHESNGLRHLQLLYSESAWKRAIKSVIQGIKETKGKKEDIVNTNIQVCCKYSVMNLIYYLFSDATVEQHRVELLGRSASILFL